MRGVFGYIHLFVRGEPEMKRELEKARSHLAPDGMMWVSWPKRASGGGMTMKDVIRVGYDPGLVESTGLSVDGMVGA